jgi:Predicted membrane protein
MTETRGLLVSLYSLTFVTGLVDAVSFLGLGHVFTANMTGNVVFLGFAVAGAPGLSIPRSLVSLIAFLIGSAVGGRIGVAMAVKNRRRWLLAVAGIETVLLLVAAIVSAGFNIESGTPLRQLYVVIILTALAMGVRNATVRRLAVPDMTTTVLTLTLTGLAADSSFAGGSNTRLGRRTASVLLMFLGAASGALLLRWGASLPLALSCICMLVTAMGYTALRTTDQPTEGVR